MINKIKIMFKFKKQDWKHILWLSKIACVSLFKGKFNDFKEALLWINIHFSYSSKPIESNKTIEEIKK